MNIQNHLNSFAAASIADMASVFLSEMIGEDLEDSYVVKVGTYEGINTNMMLLDRDGDDFLLSQIFENREVGVFHDESQAQLVADSHPTMHCAVMTVASYMNDIIETYNRVAREELLK
ncbi:hypothetical protein [Vibrio phage YC]|uniref:Uncharacterized protein n=1 Tax=Vibrio phage YC TaxID=2267403 RepID=A0A384ZS32_9CAUD|nr:hypothetical protein HWB64_gp074 [Vibrio phage YC]AXC34443.1 hypothetical protein [Vibrio phage YC]